MGLMARASQQFHWENERLRRFRRFPRHAQFAQAQEHPQGTRRGPRLRRADRRADRRPDQNPNIGMPSGSSTRTPARGNGGSLIFTRSFFDLAQDWLRDDMLLVLALRDGRCPVAGALNFIGRRRALTAATGAAREASPTACIFENCATIRRSNFAIAHGLSRFEAGAQGNAQAGRGLTCRCQDSFAAHWVARRGLWPRPSLANLEAEREGGGRSGDRGDGRATGPSNGHKVEEGQD